MEKKEEKKLQTEFNITKDNYEMYNTLIPIKSKKLVYTTVKSMAISLGIGLIEAMLVIASSIGIVYLINPESVLLAVIAGIIDMGAIIAISIGTNKIIDKISLNDFKKKYPNINTDVDVKSLEKALTKYNELSKLKDMEQKKDHFLTLHSDEYNKMTTEEKMDSLNKEIEYLGQVMIEEKYRDDSTKDSEKVLKKTYTPNNK